MHLKKCDVGSIQRPKLICLPYAGGSQYVFTPWIQALEGRIDVIAPELPGRGRRIMEAPKTRLRDVVHWLSNELHDVLHGDFALWGHSMGALLAYELARTLAANERAMPRHLFLSGARPPQLPRHTERYHELDDAALASKLSQMNGTPVEVLADSDLMALILPTVRADFAICETYHWHPDPHTLHVPMTVIGGDQDPDIPVAKLQGWRSCTNGPVSIIEMAGHHFFLRDQVEAITDVLVETLISPTPLRTAG
ncbi:thioesterase II family protein [Solilutibacter pythonis]|uniref:thioesterase II family protein n=1 Tax=Solilutibacter pythonis TaxID=2483112 RepID=UPI001313EDD7|nr:alpha/beta fold hydrolase [Lysobacter pythonis]